MSAEFNAGLVKGKLPVGGSLAGVALGYAGGNLGREFVQGGDALVQVLAGDSREFEFDHIEPGGVFGRVVHLEAGSQGAGFGRLQMLVKDGIGVGVEVILHQHDFLGLRVVGSQLLHKAAAGCPGAPGRYLARRWPVPGSKAASKQAVPWRT